MQELELKPFPGDKGATFRIATNSALRRPNSPHDPCEITLSGSGFTARRTFSLDELECLRDWISEALA